MTDWDVNAQKRVITVILNLSAAFGGDERITLADVGRALAGAIINKDLPSESVDLAAATAVSFLSARHGWSAEVDKAALIGITASCKEQLVTSAAKAH